MSRLPFFRSAEKSPRPSTRRGSEAARSRKARMGLELLEDRAVPAVFVVNSLADILNPGPGVVTLRSAINQANNTPGPNTINLNVAGTYKITLPGANTGTDTSGAFAILPTGGNLTIQNTSHGNVTIDGGFMDRVFDINPTAQTATPFSVTIAGVTITNGDASPGDGAAGSGGGIRDQGAASLTLNNDTITNCFATADGGGVSMENAVNTPWHLTVNNSTITNCHAGDAGGGVEEDGQGVVAITNSVINSNTCVNQGAGLWLDAVNNVTANTTLTGDTFAFNVAFNGPTGAIGNAGNASVVINGCTVENNFVGGTAQGGGGFGDENGLGNLSVTNSLFVNNVAVTNGGAIFTGASGTTTTITNTLIQGNSASSGGGIEDAGTTLSLTNVALFANHAVSNNNADGGNGGGLDVPTDSAVSVTKSLFLDNTAINQPSGPDGILGSPGSSTFTGDGGGIFQSAGTLLVTNSQFTANLASVDGGAVLFTGLTLTASNDTFNANQATTDAGGALALMPTGLVMNMQGSSVTNSTITANTTLVGGGGIADVGPGDLALEFDTINANRATTEGGGIAFVVQSGAPILSVQNTIIAGNTAGNGPDVFTMGGAVTDLGGNLVTTLGQGNTGFSPTNTITTNPNLATLQNNGGPTIGVLKFPGYNGMSQVLQTEAIQFNSSAGSKGVATGITTDERGFPRPGKIFAKPSIGAFEPQFKGAASQLFGIGTDGQVYGRNTDTAGDPTGGYFKVGGPVLALQVVHLGSTATEIFVIGTDHQLYAATFDASGNTAGYFAVFPGANALFASIAAGTDTSGNPLVFGVGTDNQLYEAKFDVNGNLSGNLTKAVAGDFKSAVVTHDASGNPLVYAVGQDQQVYGLQLDATGTPLGGLFKVGGPVTQIAVGALPNGNPEIFAIGTDKGLYRLMTGPTGMPTSGFMALGATANSLTVGADASNNPLLYVIGTDNQVYGHKFDTNGAPTGSFFSTGFLSGGASSISLGSNGSDTPELWVIKADQQVYSAPLDATGGVVTPGTYNLVAPGQFSKISNS